MIKRHLALALLISTCIANALDLTESYNLALENDSDLQIAVATKDANSQTVNQTLAKLLPRIDGSISHDLYNANNATTGVNEGDRFKRFTVSAKMPIVNLPLILQYKNSKKGLEITKLQFKYAEQTLIKTITTNYFALLDAIAELNYQENRVLTFSKQLEQANQRFELGMIAIADVHAAEAQYDRAHVELLAAQDALANAYEDLVQITGPLSNPQLKKLSNEISFDAPEHNEEYWAEHAFKYNLDVRTKRAALTIAKDNINIKQAEFLPSVSITTSVSNTVKEGGDLFNKPNRNVALVGEGNIFAGGATWSERKAYKASYRKAKSELDKTLKEVNSKIRKAYRGVVTATKQIKALEKALVSGKANLDASEAQYEVGTTTIYELLDQKNKYLQYKNNLAKAKHQYIVQKITLKLLAGELSRADIDEVNNLLK